MSLGRQATTGAIWNYASFLASKGLLLVATIILARVLSEDQIGLMSMALLVIGNWLLAPFAAGFFQTTSAAQVALLTSMIQVLGFSLLFSALGSTQDSLLQKEVNFRRRMIPEVGRTFVKGGLQVGLALVGFGVWSLVLGQV